MGARSRELTGRARTRRRGHPIPLQFSGRWTLPDNSRAEEQATPTSAVGDAGLSRRPASQHEAVSLNEVSGHVPCRVRSRAKPWIRPTPTSECLVIYGKAGDRLDLAQPSRGRRARDPHGQASKGA